MRGLSLIFLSLWTGWAAAVTPTAPPSPYGASPNDWQVQVQRLQRLLLEQEQLLQALQAEVRQVRGENEELSYKLGQLSESQTNIAKDFDERLSQLESGAVNRPANDLENSDTLEAPLTETENEQQAAEELATEDQTLNALDEIPETIVPPPPKVLSQQEQYQNAFNLLQAGKFDQAIQGFASLLKNHPSGAYADKAQYWMGESQYAKYDYHAALRSFNAVLENYPNSGKGAHALLKIGYSYDALGNSTKARQVLQYVRDKYPGTSIARLAQERLQRLR